MAERFKKVYTQGTMNVIEIWVDTETGVNYFCREVGTFVPLLDCEGKPVITHEFDSVGFKIEK